MRPPSSTASRNTRSTRRGCALLLAPLVYPARGTAWVEHLAIVWSTLATLACALLLRELLRGLSSDRGLVNATTLLAILGSPTWHYGRMLFSEPWLALCAVGALSLATRKIMRSSSPAYFWRSASR